MIAIYKKSGINPKSDITSGLLDPFYIDPAFNPDELRESSAPSNAKDESDRVPMGDSADFFGDLESSTPKYSMRMPVSASAMKSAAKISAAPAVKSAPYYAALDDEWTSPSKNVEDKKDNAFNADIDHYDDDWEDESSWTQMKKGGPKSPSSLPRTLPTAIPSSTPLMSNSTFNGALLPPPGFGFEKFGEYYDTDQTERDIERAIEESKKYNINNLERDMLHDRKCDVAGDVLIEEENEENRWQGADEVEFVDGHEENNDSDWAIVDAEKGEA